jgi:hypothetical protein
MSLDQLSINARAIPTLHDARYRISAVELNR